MISLAYIYLSDIIFCSNIDKWLLFYRVNYYKIDPAKAGKVVNSDSVTHVTKFCNTRNADFCLS